MNHGCENAKFGMSTKQQINRLRNQIEEKKKQLDIKSHRDEKDTLALEINNKLDALGIKDRRVNVGDKYDVDMSGTVTCLVGAIAGAFALFGIGYILGRCHED